MRTTIGIVAGIALGVLMGVGGTYYWSTPGTTVVLKKSDKVETPTTDFTICASHLWVEEINP